MQETQNSENNPDKEEKRGLTLPNFISYNKAKISQCGTDWHKDRSMQQNLVSKCLHL